MTRITDGEAAEVLWASSEAGRAAVRAGWDRAQQAGIAGHPVTSGGRPIDMADIAAVVYAAFRAVPPDGEPGEAAQPAGHEHDWAVLGAQEAPVTGIPSGTPRTLVLGACRSCGQPATWTLDGTWTAEDLTGTVRRSVAEAEEAMASGEPMVTLDDRDPR